MKIKTAHTKLQDLHIAHGELWNCKKKNVIYQLKMGELSTV